MMRRCIVHVLLSLLLLVSQQMALVHAMSHWTGKLGAGNPAAQQLERDADLSSAVAQDQSCSQCLAFAQMAGAIGSSTRSFVPLDLRTERVTAFAFVEASPSTVPVFHSRAPPRFV
ncbi:hypothetical protein G4G28_11750 [Massilia sp. Dwa41.01b]|uniref:hypothetical protein n=1 Tax=unclassified Massilia TaxID=2609279 RepID=UPI0016038838|nr:MULTISPECIES: hypothetical protein [unclassified Massilia]QNA88986.1 hypothetical protein G4G28_11750 [Massilia sp. Dwa41.01b]QNA99877.1 hypothetical protein G4G31_15380 [Massilia sp. Se16.2.3]